MGTARPLALKLQTLYGGELQVGTTIPFASFSCSERGDLHWPTVPFHEVAELAEPSVGSTAVRTSRHRFSGLIFAIESPQ